MPAETKKPTEPTEGAKPPKTLKWGTKLSRSIKKKFVFTPEQSRQLVLEACKLACQQIPKDQYSEELLEKKATPIVAFLCGNLKHREDLRQQFLGNKITPAALMRFTIFDYNSELEDLAKTVSSSLKILEKDSRGLIWEVAKQILLKRKSVDVSAITDKVVTRVNHIMLRLAENAKLMERVRARTLDIHLLAYFEDADFACSDNKSTLDT